MDETKYKLDAWNPSTTALLRATAKMIRLQASEIQDQAQKQTKLATDLIREANELTNLAADMERGELSDFKVDQQIKTGSETESGETGDQGKQEAEQAILPEDVSTGQEPENAVHKRKLTGDCDH